jgi:predicted acylesterase/phospholipase RssA
MLFRQIIILFILMRLYSVSVKGGKHINSLLSNKSLIYISPGGFKGLYMLGVSTFIKNTYDTSDYIFSGASAGAWVSLFMTCKKDNEELIRIIGILDKNLDKKNIKKIIEINLKKIY